MEASPKRKSQTLYYNLANTDEMYQYASYLGKLYNNLHKYTIVSNDILEDQFGSPYVLLHYYDNLGLEERQHNKKAVMFDCKIFFVPNNLDEWDEIITRHIDEADQLKITFIGDYTIKDKENPLIFKLVIYVQPAINDATVNLKDAEKVSPKQGSKKK